jgi:threonine aldolase
MRAAMAAAEVGDDVYGEDPTINLLEKRAAEIFDREAALFVPTGTMGNQVAIKVHTKPGQEIVCESRAHILDWEMATTASFAGCLIRAVIAGGPERPGIPGILTWEHIEPVLFARGGFHAPTGLIEIENTANLAGGTVTPLPILEEIWHNAKKRSLPIHLDGARIFNAATAAGPQLNQDIWTAVRTLTSGFDTVMFCLSKGLCAPVGSMVVGSKEAILDARDYRKALGGGMRQAGILAAAGLIALEKMPLRLHEDHANAKLLAESLAKLPEIDIDLGVVQTNIVIFGLKTRKPADFVKSLKKKGVYLSQVGPRTVRLVTHHDTPRAACQKAAERIAEELQ